MASAVCIGLNVSQFQSIVRHSSALRSKQAAIPCYRIHVAYVDVQSGTAADGSYLLAVDDGDKRSLVVWEWRSRRQIARTTVSLCLDS